MANQSQTNSTTVPLCVDLDGTLVSTDTLWEGVVRLLISNPMLLFPMIGWALAGKARLKHEVATRAKTPKGGWPVRSELADWIMRERQTGRPVILVTGAAAPVAELVAADTGLFDDVMHSTTTENLTSTRKRDRLIERFGAQNFDYAGNSSDDIPVFEAAREAIVVAPDPAAKKYQQQHGSQLFEGPAIGLKTLAKAIRVHQWMKNVLIAIPMVLAHQFLDLSVIGTVLVAFFSFSFLASAVYLVNDMTDLENDRRHPTKCRRPLASGALSIPVAVALAVSLVAASLSLALTLPPLFLSVLLIYAAATTAYTFFLKRKLLVDVMTLAGLYTIRIIAGAAATGIENSFWLLSFSIFFFLSLALVKRYVELDDLSTMDGEATLGRGYYAVDFEMIGQAGIASAFASALVLALYIDSSAVKSSYQIPELLWPLVPLILYLVLRIWILARRSQLQEDPVEFILRDWRSQLTCVVCGVLVLAAAF